MNFKRIAVDPRVMGGRPCIRGTRVPVGLIVGMLGEGITEKELLELYPHITADDIREAMKFAAWRVEEQEVEIATK